MNTDCQLVFKKQYFDRLTLSVKQQILKMA